MAFTDQLLAHSDATVTVVDRRHAPGGHWVDAYLFVRLHQPSAFYGVSSVPLGQGALDSVGTNAGYYELAGRDEICAHFERAMHRHFLPTGRVRYFPNCDYVGEHRFVSRLTGSRSGTGPTQGRRHRLSRARDPGDHPSPVRGRRRRRLRADRALAPDSTSDGTGT